MRTSPLSIVGLLAMTLTLAGCFETGVGDPAKSKIDPKLVGMWEAPGSDYQLLVKPWDDRTYLIMEMKLDIAGTGRWEVKGDSIYKAWLTPVNGDTFITLEAQQTTPRKDRFAVARLTLTGDTAKVEGIATKSETAAVRTPEQFEKYILENSAKPGFFVEKAQEYRRVR